MSRIEAWIFPPLSLVFGLLRGAPTLDPTAPAQSKRPSAVSGDDPKIRQNRLRNASEKRPEIVKSERKSVAKIPFNFRTLFGLILAPEGTSKMTKNLPKS